MDRSNIEKIAKSAEDRLLLAKLWDKIDTGMRKNIPAATCFLSPRELELARRQRMGLSGPRSSLSSR